MTTQLSSGQSIYQVRLKNQAGQLVAIFDNWISLTYVHDINKRGNARFEINANDDRVDLFELDGQFEVWRRNPIVGLDWYLEWEGFYRTNNDLYQQNDNNNFVAYMLGYLDLARRAHVMYSEGSAGATKSDTVETVMKEFVIENIGSSALASNGREYNNVMPGLGVQADGADGPTWDDTVSGENLLQVLQDISLFSTQQNDTIDFDIVGVGDALFQFNTYSGQRGTDRTEGNADGTLPVIFGLQFGNMIMPILSNDRTNEITAVYALGRGTDDAKQIVLVQSANRADSPWNRIEKIVNVGSASGDDQTDQLTSAARSELENGKFDTRISFDVMQVSSTYYGKDYWWGDLVSVRFKDLTFDKKIIEVRVTVSQNAEGESIALTFADK